MEENSRAMLPLSGIRIVDFTHSQAGPSATQLLASTGAEVIKVESPAGGDSARGTMRDAGSPFTLPNGSSYMFENYNRDKTSIAIDLTKEKGRQIIYSLVAKSNVFVQNHRPGTTQKLGMDYKTLQKYNPSLVYANCSGYGLKGKRASQSAADKIGHAMSGLMLGIGEPDMPPISLEGCALADMTTGLVLANAISIALVAQSRTGVGQELHVSMLGSMIWLQTNNLLYALLHKKTRPRHSRAKSSNPLGSHYRCKDGGWIQLSRPQERYWASLCRVLGLNELINDPRFHNLNAREQNSTELVSILDRAFATKTRDEWVDILSAEDIICSPIKDYWEVVNDPQVLENEYIVEFEHPSLGKLKEVGIPMEFSKAPRLIREPAPQLGQHTEEVLINILGFSWEEIEGLRDRKVIL